MKKDDLKLLLSALRDSSEEQLIKKKLAKLYDNTESEQNFQFDNEIDPTVEDKIDQDPFDLFRLSDDIISHVISYLPIKSLSNFSSAIKRSYLLANRDILWKNLFIKNFPEISEIKEPKKIAELEQSDKWCLWKQVYHYASQLLISGKHTQCVWCFSEMDWNDYYECEPCNVKYSLEICLCCNTPTRGSKSILTILIVNIFNQEVVVVKLVMFVQIFSQKNFQNVRCVKNFSVIGVKAQVVQYVVTSVSLVMIDINSSIKFFSHRYVLLI